MLWRFCCRRCDCIHRGDPLISTVHIWGFNVLPTGLDVQWLWGTKISNKKGQGEKQKNKARREQLWVYHGLPLWKLMDSPKQMSSDHNPGVLQYKGIILPSYMGILIRHHKDPYKPSRILWNVIRVLNTAKFKHGSLQHFLMVTWTHNKCIYVFYVFYVYIIYCKLYVKCVLMDFPKVLHNPRPPEVFFCLKHQKTHIPKHPSNLTNAFADVPRCRGLG